MKTKTVQANLIIHLYALAHLAGALLLRHFDMGDEVVLSVLTIAMIIQIAWIYRFPLEIASALALLSCFAGFYIGVQGGDFIQRIPGALFLKYANACATFVVTEILGWVAFFIVHNTQRKQPSK